MAKATNETLKLDALVLDDEFQLREGEMQQFHLDDMVEHLKDKKGSFERIRVVRVAGVGDIVVNGFYRCEAHSRAGLKTIQAVVQTGTLLDAAIAAAAANKEHDVSGLKRRPADKRKAVNFLLARLHAAGEDWTDKRIADEVGVSNHLVKECRALGKFQVEESEDSPEIPLADPPKTSKDGRQFKPKPAAVPATDGESWESIPLDEFLEVDDYVQEALNRSRIMTAGDLLSRIYAGESFSLGKMEIHELREACEDLRDEELAAAAGKVATAEKKAGDVKTFDFRAFDTTFRALVKAVDVDLPAHYPGEHMAAERPQCIGHLNAFRKVWDAWVARITKE